MTKTTSIKELQRRAQLPVNQAGGATVGDFFEQNKGALAAVLPKHVSKERLLKLALGAIRNVPQLQECTVTSLFGAAVQCAQLGLEPNTVLGHAYMLPFRNRKKQRTDVQVIIGYRGMLDLARRSGQIVSISAHEVCEHDEFEWAYGLEEKLVHVPADGERGPIKYFYAVAHLAGGGHAFEVMTHAQVVAVMRKTQSKGEYGPWKDHFIPMGRKTVIRQLFKYLPVSIEMATATAVDELGERSGDQNMESVLEGTWTPVEDGDEEQEQQEDYEAERAAADTKKNQDNEPAVWPKIFFDQETGEEGWTDADNAIFDPTKHGVKADGTPAMTPSGLNFRKRRTPKRKGTAGKAHHQEDSAANSAHSANSAQEGDQGNEEYAGGNPFGEDME